MSKVSLCNLALRRVGEQTITSLTEVTKNAKLCNELYQETLEEVLRNHTWNCAKFRVELAQDADTPTYGWTYQYSLPVDPRCVRVLRMEDTESEWVIEGTKLLTDEGTVKILYVGDTDNPEDLDPLCRKVVYLEMAAAMAYTLVENNTILNGIEAQLDKAWSDARGVNAQEGTKMQTQRSQWLESRYQGIGAGISRNNVR